MSGVGCPAMLLLMLLKLMSDEKERGAGCASVGPIDGCVHAERVLVWQQGFKARDLSP